MATSFDKWPASLWQRVLFRGLLLLLLSIFATGCASYTDRIRKAQGAVAGGDPDRAMQIINKQLRVDSHLEQPEDLKGVGVLLLMERALLLQARGDFEASARDLMAADERLEWLTIRGRRGAELVRYFYTDDAGQYQAPPHERLLINTLNMVNFLAANDLSAARVEARRFDLLQTYYLDENLRELLPAILGLGNYLAGAAFEASYQYEEAARFYILARLHGIWPENHEERLLDLIALTGYRGSGLGELRPQAQPLFERAKSRLPIDRAAYQAVYQSGDLLLVVQTGLSPFRQAARIPIDAALNRSSSSPYASFYLDNTTYNQALTLYDEGIFSWINLPVLSRRGLPPRRTVFVHLPGQSLQLASPISIANQVEQTWSIIDGTAIAAAISRAVVRALASTASGATVDMIAQEAGADSDLAGLIGWLVSLVVQSSMSAADTPDTRSWTTLPADIHLLRLQMEPGAQSIHLQVDGHSEMLEFELSPHRLRLINASRLR